MARTNSREFIDLIRSGDLGRVRAAIRREPETARMPQVVVEASRIGWKAALGLLLEHGADLNASWRNYRPLHALIQQEPHAKPTIADPERLECLRWMLTNGADPELLGGWPATRAITTAAFAGQPEHVSELRRAGAVVDPFVASALGDLRRVERAVTRDSSFAIERDPGGLSALHCSTGSRLGARNGKIQKALFDIATLLLDNGAEVGASARSWTHDVDAVYFAVSSGQDNVFALLLERGADATQALTPTVWRNNIDLAELALSHGAEIDRAVDEGKPLLNQMIRWGQVKQTLWLLEHGANPNITDEQGWTATHQAASRGNERLLRAVLEAGGKPELQDDDGNTPADIARMRVRPKMVALLGD
jgi:ankyrin repeat protein